MVVACTVAWPGSEVHLARLRQGLCRHTRADELVVLWDGRVPPQVDGVRFLTPTDLSPRRSHRLLHRYFLSTDQWRTWLQAALVAHLLEERDTHVLWMSLDSLLLAPVDDVVEAASAAGLSLVSRVPDVPATDDLDPTSAHTARAGVVATSLLAATRAALPAIEWWTGQTRTDTAGRPWLDQVAAGRSAALLRDDGLSVSATSIGTDVVGGTPERPVLRGTSVRHLDLAGHDPERPWLLDARLSRPRVLLSRQLVLAALLDEHRPSSDGEARSTHATRDLDPQMRSLVRRAIDDPAAFGEPLPSPTGSDSDSRTALIAWALRVDAVAAPLTRYLNSVYQDRPDLKAAIPGVPERHVDQFLSWTDDHARHESRYDADLLSRSLDIARSAAPSSDPTSREPRPAPGVHVVGYLNGELGIGESARLMLRALDAVRIRRTSTSISPRLQSRQEAAFVDDGSTTRLDTALLCVNSDTTAEAVALVPHLLTGRYRIGMWYWEVEAFDQPQGFTHLDEVWVATDFVRDAVAPHSPVPVHVVTPPLPQRHDRPLPGRSHLGLPEDRRLVLFSFDYLSTAERKNPWGAVEAFRRASRRLVGSARPLLVIKSINADVRPTDAERLRLMVADDPEVLLLEDYLTADDRDGLMAACDVYLSLHRAEGLGLTMAEAMAWGKPVVATAYSGNLQFMTADNSLLVPWRPVPIGDGCAPYPAGTPWADPDLEAAAAHLVRVLEDEPLRRRIGQRAARDIATLHSPAAAGAVAQQRLDAIRRTDPNRRTASPAAARKRRGLR